MSIRKTVQELRSMAENLEATGFDNGQAQSAIEAIAVSIERFAVTPEVFAREFNKQNKEIDRRFAEQNSDMNRQFTELRAAIKSTGTRQFAMMWGVIVMMLGLLATNFMQQVL